MVESRIKKETLALVLGLAIAAPFVYFIMKIIIAIVKVMIAPN